MRKIAKIDANQPTIVSEKACKYCEKKFHIKPSQFNRRVYCCITCRRADTQHKQTCLTCCKVFNARSHKGIVRKYCSRPCLLISLRQNQPSKNCKHCGKNFSLPPSQLNKKAFCGKPCRDSHLKATSPGIDFFCNKCGKAFKAYEKRLFCSIQCRAEFHYREKPCSFCQKVFKIKPSHYDITFYCSRDCAAKDYKTRLTGNQNPNYKNAGQKFCVGCKSKFKSYTANRLYCSAPCFQRNNVSKFIGKLNDQSRGKIGKRADLNNLFVRSSWEANYARYLNWLINQKQILSWEYEPDTFEFKAIKKGTRFYMPDFKITNLDGSIEYHEVKGYMDAKSATKLKRMAKYYPEIKIVLIDKLVYGKLKDQLKRIIPNWE